MKYGSSAVIRQGKGYRRITYISAVSYFTWTEYDDNALQQYRP